MQTVIQGILRPDMKRAIDTIPPLNQARNGIANAKQQQLQSLRYPTSRSFDIFPDVADPALRCLLSTSFSAMFNQPLPTPSVLLVP